MALTNKYLLSFLVMVVLMACGNEQSRKADYADDIIRDIPNIPDEPPSIGSHSEGFDELVDAYESQNRYDWQKPNEIIASLGDLSDKTVVDLGAGTGYFAFRILPFAKKVIAVDIDPRMIAFMEDRSKKLNDPLRDRFELRFATSDNPKLAQAETDVIIVANTYIYIEGRVEYFRQLKRSIKPGGLLMIIDYKKKNLPIGPPNEAKISVSQVEEELQKAGYGKMYSDDQTLPYQYIVYAIVE